MAFAGSAVSVAEVDAAEDAEAAMPVDAGATLEGIEASALLADAADEDVAEPMEELALAAALRWRHWRGLRTATKTP